MKNTKIICTLGPASDEKNTIKKMVEAGMDVARLNFSHGTYSHFNKIINNLKAVSKELKKPIAIIQDLQGPKIRVGKMPEKGIHVEKNHTIALTTRSVTAGHRLIPVQYENLAQEVQKNHHILIDDGLIEFIVMDKKKLQSEKKYTEIICKALTNGTIYSHKGINLPQTKVSAPSLSEKDRKDLAFGLKNNVDYVALSFVRNASDILELRTLLKAYKKPTRLIAKIETPEALKNLEGIIHASDAIMVARGDLGIEIEAARVPLVQKEIVRMSLTHGKPVIIATQMLQSMIENPRASRAEISDTAGAVLEYADALMLSNETSVGEYPVEATETLSRVATIIEDELENREIILKNKLHHRSFAPLVAATSRSACIIAQNLGAKYLVIITHSGYSAEQIVRHRPFLNLVTITDQENTKRALQLVWGINHVHVLNYFENEKAVLHFMKRHYKLKTGEQLVIYNSSKKKNLISTVII